MIILKDNNKTIVSTPDKITKILQDWLASIDKIDQNKEHFFSILLNARNQIKLIEIVSIGTLNSSIASPREVFVRAIKEQSASIIIAHNHPSNNAEPSDDDITITKRLKEAGKILDIELVDSLIITKDNYYSFKKNQLL